MNIFIDFSASYYLACKDGEVAVELTGWLLQRLEGLEVMLGTMYALLVLRLLSPGPKQIPHPSFRREVPQHYSQREPFSLVTCASALSYGAQL